MPENENTPFEDLDTTPFEEEADVPADDDNENDGKTYSFPADAYVNHDVIVEEATPNYTRTDEVEVQAPAGDPDAEPDEDANDFESELQDLIDQGYRHSQLKVTTNPDGSFKAVTILTGEQH